MKKIIKTITSIVLLSAITLSLTSATFADNNTFSDVPATHWANANIEKAVKADLLNGYGDNTFKPENTMSKLEFLSVIGLHMAKNYGYVNEKLRPSDDKGNAFIAKFNPPEWAKFNIRCTYNAYIINENDTEFFDYNEPITRAEIAKIIRRVEISDEWLDEIAKKTGYGKPDGVKHAYYNYLVKDYINNTSEEQLQKDYEFYNSSTYGYMSIGEIDGMMNARPDLYTDIRTTCAYKKANFYESLSDFQDKAYKWLAEWNLEQITLRQNETLENKPVEANAIADWNAIAAEDKPAIASVYKAKIVNGYEDGTFRADNVVTRAEAATMILNAYEYLPKNGFHGGTY